MIPNDEQVSEMINTVKAAHRVIGELPEPLQAAAMPVVLELLLNGQSGVATPRLSKEHEGLHEDSSDLPPIDVVSERGTRTQRALYAVEVLAGRQELCTAAAIQQYADQEMARELTNLSVVLKEATPKYLRRRKEGREFTYESTLRGRELLAGLGTNG